MMLSFSSPTPASPNFSLFREVEQSFFDEQFNIKVKGLYFTVQGALPLIPDGGSILLNASVVDRKGFPGTSVYSATNAAVRSFGRTLATELAPRRIRVNTISPRPVDTPIFSKDGQTAAEIEEPQKGLAQSPALKPRPCG
jgi:NAD(P)-dependent dehydrogenase (short-subunit alcohol dehydrogenase family)